MTVFSCHELAEDWQIAPKTPVITTRGGHSSLNFDNYDDLERGLQPLEQYPTQYPNIPDVFRTEHSLPAGESWSNLVALFAAAQPGDVIWFEDGYHDWEVEGEVFLTLNRTFPHDNPVFLLSRNKHQAEVFEGVATTVRIFGAGVVLGGFLNNTWAILGDAYFRVTSCLSLSIGSVKIPTSARGAGGKNDNIEFDNNEFDGQETNALFGISIDMNSGAVLFEDDHQEHIRIHHNYFHDCIQGPNINHIWWMGLGGQEDISTMHYKAIMENNLAERWEFHRENYEMKCGGWIMRHNTFVEQGEESGQRFRAHGNIMYYGNWNEEAHTGTIASANYNICIAFNFTSSADASGKRCFGFHTHEDNYGDQDNRLIKYNVFSGTGQLLSASSPGVGTIDYQSDCLVEGNHLYSAFTNDSDVDGAGNYNRAGDVGFGLNLSETDWRAQNVWGVNTYTLTPLNPTMNEVDPSLFVGPGEDIVGDIRFPLMYGQPSQIKMPSWWK